MKRVQIISITIFLVVLVGLVVFIGSNSSTNSRTAIPNVQNSGKITLEVLSTHSIPSDCWVGYKGKVYNITNWLPKHPGSSKAIEPYCGTYEEFENAFTNKHGSFQVETLLKEGIYKGELE